MVVLFTYNLVKILEQLWVCFPLVGDFFPDGHLCVYRIVDLVLHGNLSLKTVPDDLRWLSYGNILFWNAFLYLTADGKKTKTLQFKVWDLEQMCHFHLENSMMFLVFSDWATNRVKHFHNNIFGNRTPTFFLVKYYYM